MYVTIDEVYQASGITSSEVPEANIKEFIKRMKKNKKQYHFVEFMGCTGGCINGGGQPIHPAKIQDSVDISALRTQSLYDMDSSKKHRESRTNKLLMRMYKDWLGEPNSELAHNLLHTSYTERKFYK